MTVIMIVKYEHLPGEVGWTRRPFYPITFAEAETEEHKVKSKDHDDGKSLKFAGQEHKFVSIDLKEKKFT